MDKIDRILSLYSKLIQGEKVNKFTFCVEMECTPRTFDRDVEDIRMYLSEVYSSRELIYNRYENVYYLSGMHRKELDETEYQIIERILLDSRVLRQDELTELMLDLSSNTNKMTSIENLQKDISERYEPPLHDKALLKMHSDLLVAIRNKLIIKLQYTKMDGTEVERQVVPCSLKYDRGYLYLIAFLLDGEKQYPAYLRLDRIYSFTVIRSQYRDEKQMVDYYTEKYAKGIVQMYGGEYREIIVSCKDTFYPYVYDKFREVQKLEKKEGVTRVRLKAFDDGFVKWIMGQPPDMIRVIEPIELSVKIAQEARKILKIYMEVLENGKED